jgi:cytochrome c553
MTRTIATALLTLLLSPAAAQTPPAAAPTPLIFPEGLPEWAFNIPDAVQPPVPPIAGIVRVPGSAREYDAAAIAGNNNPPDWFPEEHPPAPRVVAGPAPNACGSCHLMSGQGHPESADIAGLPVAYFVRQMSDFKTGARREVNRMEPIARALSDEDVRLAAEYYADLRRRRSSRSSKRRRRRKLTSAPMLGIAFYRPKAAPSPWATASCKYRRIRCARTSAILSPVSLLMFRPAASAAARSS